TPENIALHTLSLHDALPICASAAAVYWRTVDRIHEEHLWMARRLERHPRDVPDLSFSRARELAATALRDQKAVVFPHYSLLMGDGRFDRLPTPEDREFRPLHRESCGFPSPVEMLREIGARD